jgi:hypothetical protein
MVLRPISPCVASEPWSTSKVSSVEIGVAERAPDLGRLAELVEPDKNRVARLGILGVDIGDTGADLASTLRVPSGVTVVAHTSDEAGPFDMDLAPGDTIHSLNGPRRDAAGLGAATQDRS